MPCGISRSGHFLSCRFPRPLARGTRRKHQGKLRLPGAFTPAMALASGSRLLVPAINGYKRPEHSGKPSLPSLRIAVQLEEENASMPRSAKFVFAGVIILLLVGGPIGYAH